MRRSTSSRLVWVETCRGIAATSVLLYHASRHFDLNCGMPRLRAAFQFGHSGVDLFFVISGFIILFVHFDDVGASDRIGRYIGRRLTRVLPLYWIEVVMTVAARVAGDHATAPAVIAWAILPVPIFGDALLGVSWTLQYELVFYLVFAVLILNRAAGCVAMALWLAVIAIGAVTAAQIKVPGAYWGTFNLEFFAGMAVAYRLRNGRVVRYKTWLFIGVALFVATSIAEDVGSLDGYGTFARLVYGLPASLIILGCAEASRSGNVRAPAILTRLGTASYSLYLFHLLAIGVVWQLWVALGLDNALPPTIGFCLAVAGAVVAGLMISQSIEYPLMRLIRAVTARLKFGNAVGAGSDVVS